MARTPESTARMARARRSIVVVVEQPLVLDAHLDAPAARRVGFGVGALSRGPECVCEEGQVRVGQREKGELR